MELFRGGSSDTRYIPLRAGMGLREKRKKYTFGTARKIRQKRILNGENQSDWGGKEGFLSSIFYNLFWCSSVWKGNDEEVREDRFLWRFTKFLKYILLQIKSCYGYRIHLSKTYPKQFFCAELYCLCFSETVQENYEYYEHVFYMFHIMPEM